MRSDVENIKLEKSEHTHEYREVKKDYEYDETYEEKKDMAKGHGEKKKSKYSAGKPYPEIKVECKNKQYAAILSNDFAGACSELTAVTQYINHHIKLGIINEDVSECMLGISKVEMMHLGMLGELILLLGGDPYYGRTKKEKFQCWTPRFINYGKEIKGMLKLDIQHEVDAIAQYKKHIEEINDKYIKKILERIIEDEEVHIEVIDEMLKKL